MAAIVKLASAKYACSKSNSRAVSSVGQSWRLIISRSGVQISHGPPFQEKKNMRKLTKDQKSQLEELVDDTCMGAIFEDLDVTDKARHNEAIDVLCSFLQTHKK